MCSWLPGIKIFVVDDHSHWLTSANCLGGENDIRGNACVLECEELTGTPDSTLDFVNDHGNTEFLGNPSNRLKEFLWSRYNSPPFTLDRFKDNCCRPGDATFRVLEGALKVCTCCIYSGFSTKAKGTAVGVG